MSKGKASALYLHREGLVGHSDSPDWSFIYETSLTKAPKWNIGDRVMLPDGREFRYAKSSGVCASGQACDFVATGFQSYSTPSVAAAVGDTEVTVTAGTHVALAKDALRGGYFISWPAALKDQFRGITGNDAAAADAAFTIYLDGPLTYALVAATTGLEVYENPYASLVTGSNAAKGKAGVPATYVGAANTYFWVQKAGPIFIAPQSTVIGNEGVGCMFRHDGSVEAVATAIGGTVPDTDGTQYAGYHMLGDYAGNGPLFMLNGC